MALLETLDQAIHARAEAAQNLVRAAQALGEALQREADALRSYLVRCEEAPRGRGGKRRLLATRSSAVAPEGHLTYREAATRLGTSQRSVESLVAAGALAVFRPSPRCPFIPEADLERFIAERTARAGLRRRRRT